MRGLCALAIGTGLLAPISAMAATFDLSGSFLYEIVEIDVQGACPSTGDFSGDAEIVQTGDAFTLEFQSGQPCLPTGVCSLAGTVDGVTYTGTTGPIPTDTEGGVTVTDTNFIASSMTAAAGSNVSTFTLRDFQCIWTYDLTLTAPEPEAATSAVAALALLAALRWRH